MVDAPPRAASQKVGNRGLGAQGGEELQLRVAQPHKHGRHPVGGLRRGRRYCRAQDVTVKGGGGGQVGNRHRYVVQPLHPDRATGGSVGGYGRGSRASWGGGGGGRGCRGQRPPRSGQAGEHTAG